MKPSDLLRKFKSAYLWGNLAAMVVVSGLAIWGVKYGLEVYTHHGREVKVPDVRRKSFADACHILNGAGLTVVVSDTGYVKGLRPDCVLEQNPEPGAGVKDGRAISLIVNAEHSPTLALPDVVDNSSMREAIAKLRAMGFKVGEPQYVAGEKDWVYGVVVRGRQVSTGDRISVDDMLTVQVGSGLRDESDDVEYVDMDELAPSETDDTDEFRIVEGPVQPEEPAESPAP